MQIVVSYANDRSSLHEVSKETGQMVSVDLTKEPKMVTFYDSGGDRIFLYMNHIVQVRIKA